jgi:hypothetical protein
MRVITLLALKRGDDGERGMGMDWSILVLVLVGALFLWRNQKNAAVAKAASDRLERDARLYQHIKTGMREYDWRDRDGLFWTAKDGELLFETAHLSAFHVHHFAESRVGFYFKDIDEFGLYGFFAGNGDEFYKSYFRTDRTFQKEEALMASDD